MSLLGGILPLIEMFGDAAYTKQFNDQIHSVDAQGNFYGADGNKTTIFKQPGFLARLASGQARQTASENANYQALPEMGLQQQNIAESQKELSEGREAGIARPTFANTPLWNLSDVQAGQALNRNFSPENIQQEGTALGGIQGNIVTPQVQSNINTAQKNLQDTQAALRRNSITIAANDQAEINRLSSETGLETTRIELITRQLEGELNRNPTEQEILDKDQQLRKYGQGTQDTQEQTQRILAHGAYNAAPTEARTMPIEALNQQLSARFLGPGSQIAQTPFLSEMTDKGLSLSPELSPYFNPRQFGLMRYLLQGGSMSGKDMPNILGATSNGQAVPTPPASIYNQNTTIAPLGELETNTGTGTAPPGNGTAPPHVLRGAGTGSSLTPSPPQVARRPYGPAFTIGNTLSRTIMNTPTMLGATPAQMQKANEKAKEELDKLSPTVRAALANMFKGLYQGVGGVPYGE